MPISTPGLSPLPGASVFGGCAGLRAKYTTTDLQLLENEIEQGADSVEEVLIRLEEYSLLRKALAGLDPKCRTLLTELFLKDQPVHACGCGHGAQRCRSAASGQPGPAVSKNYAKRLSFYMRTKPKPECPIDDAPCIFGRLTRLFYRQATL